MIQLVVRAVVQRLGKCKEDVRDKNWEAYIWRCFVLTLILYVKMAVVNMLMNHPR